MTTRVISAFPGTGKSYFANKQQNSGTVIDLDSNTYTSGYTTEGKAQNPDFPINYISAIESYIGTCDILFVSSHKEVVAGLSEKGIEITLIYPKRELKAEYIERYKRRGSLQLFVELLSKHWDTLISQLEIQKGCKHITLSSGQYIGDVL